MGALLALLIVGVAVGSAASAAVMVDRTNPVKLRESLGIDVLTSVTGAQGPTGPGGLTGQQGFTGDVGPTGPAGGGGSVTPSAFSFVTMYAVNEPAVVFYPDPGGHGALSDPLVMSAPINTRPQPHTSDPILMPLPSSDPGIPCISIVIPALPAGAPPSSVPNPLEINATCNFLFNNTRPDFPQSFFNVGICQSTTNPNTTPFNINNVSLLTESRLPVLYNGSLTGVLSLDAFTEIFQTSSSPETFYYFLAFIGSDAGTTPLIGSGYGQIYRIFIRGEIQFVPVV